MPTETHGTCPRLILVTQDLAVALRLHWWTAGFVHQREDSVWGQDMLERILGLLLLAPEEGNEQQQ